MGGLSGVGGGKRRGEGGRKWKFMYLGFTVHDMTEARFVMLAVDCRVE